jgi:thiosulfate dehydrogenase
MPNELTRHEQQVLRANSRRATSMNPFKGILLAGALAAHQAAAENAGERIAQQGAVQAGVVSCASCHGVDGGGNEQTGFPRLAGLDAAYIENQLHAFKQRHRKNPVMAGMAAPLTDQDIRDVAAYYAGLDPVSHAQAPAGVSTSAGEKLASYGDMPNRGLPACFQCHGPGGQGVGKGFPPLVGQPYSYLLSQLNAWKSGTRSGDPLGLMKAVVIKLTDAEAESVAAYLATQPLAEKTASANRAESGEVASSGAAKAATHGKDMRAAPPADHGEVEPGREPGAQGYFQPPPRSAYPEGKMGDTVRLGEVIFNATNTHPLSAPYVGNKQVCSGCHLDTGRLANSAPLWASWVAYPAYRKKHDRMNTFIERIQGCFAYSMNAQGSETGNPPEADSDVMLALVSYAYWLATGAPTGDQRMPGRGFAKLAEPPDGFDPQRGENVYANTCAFCHGEHGEGQFAQGQLVFPPLWGPNAYNWGAGMHSIKTAAAFIKLNMPFGLADPLQKKGLLTDQQAWDVAAWMNSQERPQDPRFNGDLAATTKQYHDGKYDYYGKLKNVDGKLLGEDAPVQ